MNLKKKMIWKLKIYRNTFANEFVLQSDNKSRENRIIIFDEDELFKIQKNQILFALMPYFLQPPKKFPNWLFYMGNISRKNTICLRFHN